jgi:hypothetical protein
VSFSTATGDYTNNQRPWLVTSHRTRTLQKPISRNGVCKTLIFSASVSRNLALPKRLGFGKAISQLVKSSDLIDN